MRNKYISTLYALTTNNMFWYAILIAYECEIIDMLFVLRTNNFVFVRTLFVLRICIRIFVFIHNKCSRFVALTPSM